MQLSFYFQFFLENSYHIHRSLLTPICQKIFFFVTWNYVWQVAIINLKATDSPLGKFLDFFLNLDILYFELIMYNSDPCVGYLLQNRSHV